MWTSYSYIVEINMCCGNRAQLPWIEYLMEGYLKYRSIFNCFSI